MTDEVRDVVIAGSGMAGLTAAIYAARADLAPLVLEGDEPGGQLTLTTDVENFPGFPEGVGGVELVERTKEQAERFGAEIRTVAVDDVEGDGPFRLTLSDGESLETRTLIAASGASARWVGAENEEELMGHGLSTCATCDGAFHREDDVLVIGGGDSAMEEALFLTKFADTVTVVHRREELRASEIMKQRAMDKESIEWRWNTELLEIHGSQEDGVTGATLCHHPDGHPKEKLDAGDDDVEVFDVDVQGVFYAIGHTPNTGYLEGTGVELDATGYIETLEGRTSATAVDGIFAAGDVSDDHYQQAVTAAGMGCMAAIDAEEYLDELEREETETAAAD